METVVLKAKEDKRIKKGHLWVFSNEIEQKPESAQAGDLVRLLNRQGESLGVGFYHPHSLISVRLLAIPTLEGGQEELDRQFFINRMRRAAELRERLFAGEDCYRLIHGESDFLPGLVVDRFADQFTVQTLTTGMENRLDLICDGLEALFHPSTIIERNDTLLRRYEELPERVSVLRGNEPEPVVIQENGIRYRIDLLRGQKTGFFLDQKMNRRAAARYCSGQRVLDCFCNVGGFALNALKAGAASAVAVDASIASLEQARHNAQLNDFTSVEFVESDVFDFLERELRRREHYDVVILDPPSFTRSKKNVPAAKRAYRRINELACRILKSGGILVTASCSFHVFEEVFYEIVQESALRAGRTIRLLERRYQAPDHPILPAMPETKYLKLGIFQVL